MTRRPAEILLDEHAREVAATLSAVPVDERAPLLAWFLASIAEQVDRPHSHEARVA